MKGKLGMLAAAGCITALGLSGAGCYRYTVSSNAGNADPGTENHATEVSFLWGIEDPNAMNVDVAPDGGVPSCLDDVAPSNVTFRTNYGYMAISVLTLGTISPAEVRWTCAKPGH